MSYYAASIGNKPAGRSSEQNYLLSMNLEIYWRFCKRLKLVLVLGQLNTVCIFPSLSLNSILILSFHLSLDHIVASFFPSGFLTDILCADLICRFFIPAAFFFHLMVIDILTYSMVQSPSSEANWFAASQEIPRISRNPKVHYRTHKSPPPVPILGQPNPVHIPTSHLLESHPNIHPSTPRSPQWCPSLRFPHQDPIHPFSLPIRATCPAVTDIVNVKEG